MVFILRFAFLLLFFCFEVHEASRAKSIRVCEGQRPFNHSCAVGGKIVSLELDYCLWNALQGSAPNVGPLSCSPDEETEETEAGQSGSRWGKLRRLHGLRWR
jgi:hypothetical protein